jgi:aminoglycoside phosphotransferase (APT) family kinase protein
VSDDTAPIRADERFDEERVAAYLRVALGDDLPDAPIMFEQFPGGAANLTYLARCGEVELVLRRPPLGETAKGSHDMEREHRVLSRLWRAFPKAPRAYHFCADPAVMGKPFFVMERRSGHVIRSAWPPSLAASDDARRHLAEELVDTLADLHLVDAAEVGLGDLGYPDGFVQRQVDGWLRRWDRAKTREVADMARVAELLAASIPRPESVSLLHNDFKLDNTMCDDDGNVVAVFDWDMSTRGDALIDLGTLLAYWVDPEGPTYPIFGDQAVTMTPFMTKDEVVERYAARTGFDLVNIRFYEALALYRIAVIIEQIYARYAAGQTADSRFARFEPLAPILARSAREILERKS